MRVSEQYNLNKKQAELDFIDIDTGSDIPLFLDPFFLGLRNDKWSTEATRTIKSFFQQVINLVRADQISEAKSLFQYLTEPNSTCLGMSFGNPRGRGVGIGDTEVIFNNIIKSRAIQTGLIQDLEDNILFVDGFGKDKLSDMTTNIIRKHLIDYSIDQCILHSIPLENDVPSGFYWNRRQLRWEQSLQSMLVVNGKPILLVPKGVVSYCSDYTPDKYYNHFVLNFMQNEHLRLNSALVKKRNNGVKFVTKKSLKEKYPLSKEFLADFSQRHPEVLAEFKKETNTNALSNVELNPGVDLRSLANHLTRELQAISPGSENATKYHRLITGILELLFYPDLIYPTLEVEIHEGRKRIDITFDNASVEGVFFRLSNNMRLPSQHIMVECKNYSSDPANPELDQLAGRFSPNRGRVGLLLCRTFTDLDRFIKRCNDTYRDDRGLIIPLSDDDVIKLLNNYNNWDSGFMDKYLSDRIRLISTN
jgi:hypothetical protein